MSSRHVSRVIAASPQTVYGFAADLGNLARWAAGLARGDVVREGDVLVVDSPMGRVSVRFAPRNDFGVLDHEVTLPSGETVANPLRVLAHPEGSEVVFTLRRLGAGEEEFERDVAAVADDLDRLKRLVESGDSAAADVPRDRDGSGRPRQARPRDELGRPLPYGAIGVDPVSEEPLPPQQTVAVARELLRAGRPFAAHEVYEVAWKHRPAAERDLWQGMAQVCAGLTHAARGNTVGAERLLQRGVDRLRAYARAGGPTHGLDVAAEIDAAERQVGPHAG